MRPAVVVVGIGPAGSDLVTGAARAALASAPVIFRTGRHPAAEELAPWLPTATSTLDHLYTSSPTFAEVYEAIVDAVASDARRFGRVCYAVPGSPFVAEQTVSLLRTRADSLGIEVEYVPGLSFCDLAWARLGVDPMATGVRLVDGASFAQSAAGDHGPLLIGQCWSGAVLSDVKLALVDPPHDQRAVVLHHLGLPDEVVAEVGWSEIDRTVEADHLTSLYVADLGSPVAAELVRLTETIATLREQCPWDREQTHGSLVGHLLEETYEAIEALEGLGETPEEAPAERVQHAEEELGDLLCQVVFHANIARQEGLFELADVARTLTDKLVRRHPHVFAGTVADTAGDVVSNWERIKREEKGRAHLLDGIPAALPALARAAAVGRRLAGLGLGAPVGAGLGVGKIGANGDDTDPEAAGGQALLALAERLVHEGVDPEAALRRRIDQLVARVAEAEVTAHSEGRELADLLADKPPKGLRDGPVHS